MPLGEWGHECNPVSERNKGSCEARSCFLFSTYLSKSPRQKFTRRLTTLLNRLCHRNKKHVRKFLDDCLARDLAHAYQALCFPRLAQRHDDSPPLAQLAPEWLGNFRRGGRQQDRVEGRFFFPTKKSISDFEVYVFEAKLLNDPFGDRKSTRLNSSHQSTSRM